MIRDPITCPACNRVPLPKIVGYRPDGHVTVNGSTGRAVGCSLDGGYGRRLGQRELTPQQAQDWISAHPEIAHANKASHDAISER